MKFDQLIEFNMRNIFFEKSYIKSYIKLSPGSFVKIQIEHISGQ